MPTLTLDQIEALAARHHAAEGVRNAPKPTAIRAVYTLSSALADMEAQERHEILVLLTQEVLALPVTA